MEPLSFQEYICSLDPATLPRILRICSGVYFQGSVYEISGNECCLSTGDLLKVMAVVLQKVVCEDTETGQTTELPPTFKGLFQPAPARGPYQTLRGHVPEGGRQQGLTLHQALGQWDGRLQPLLCPAIGPHALLLRPVYEVHAAMHLRRDVVKIPSTLEVDVEDVTEEAQHIHFARPLLLSEVLGMEDVLPAQAEILEGPGNGPSTRLLCHRHGEEEEEGRELLLPLDLGGGFVEEMCDSKKYGLAELLERQVLPCEVRVVASDPGLERDALGALPALRLEARLNQPFLVGSFCQEPEEGFEIPPRWLDFSLLLSEGPIRPPVPCTRWSRVEELTEAFYYQLLAQLPGSTAPPPPRPPKPTQAGTGPGGRRPSAPGPSAPGPLPVSIRPAPPLPPLPASPRLSTPRQHGRRGPPRDAGTDSNSTEHDYETVDDNIQKTICKMKAIFPF
ncbi:PREDICTED: protein THEMIS2 [Haliaeetus leucocephalus]|uniref:protein THEMIS2 n=1 Tax=Haliaeetus leucocephalus TaxID=52644 RepID=UPI00053CB473|nr:PREDICTED: protein THEMIS2 [Haliaeetus leucocephalus]